MKRISFIDKLIYRLFHWRWSPIFANRPDMRELFISFLRAYDVLDNGEKVDVSVVITKSTHGETGSHAGQKDECP